MDLEVVTLMERPDLIAAAHGFSDDTVAPFLYQDAVSVALFGNLVARHPEFTIMALDRTTGAPVAMMCTMPFTPASDSPVDLPTGGYDAVLLTAAADELAGRRGTAVSALFATVRPHLRGRGLSAFLLDAGRVNAARLGFAALVVPVRPTRKHQHPDVPMAEYMTWRRADGLPADPWLRVHARAGCRIIGVAPHSMTITAPLDRWREWTKLPFDSTGPVYVPGGLVAVHCDIAAGTATYVEPNVWVQHDLRS